MKDRKDYRGDKFKAIYASKEARERLRIIAAMTNRSMVEVINELVREEWVRIGAPGLRVEGRENGR